jgi:hypothetical protein
VTIPSRSRYSPRYYLINGVAFNKTNSGQSLFPTAPATGIAPGTGKVLVRLINAGLRVHIPSIVGSQTGNSDPPTLRPWFNRGRWQSASRSNARADRSLHGAGKDLRRDDQCAEHNPCSTALPIFDREGSLSGNSRERDAGMLAYIGINGAAAPNVPSAAPVARNDQYTSLYADQPFAVSDPTKGVIANDSNVYSVAVSTLPVNGDVVLQPDGTFTSTLHADATFSSSFTDTFGYCANGTAACATVTLKAAPIEDAGGIIVNPDAYSANR